MQQCAHLLEQEVPGAQKFLSLHLNTSISLRLLIFMIVSVRPRLRYTLGSYGGRSCPVVTQSHGVV